MRRRKPIQRPVRRSCRPAGRRVLSRALRRSFRRGPRRLLKYNGPSLRDICTLLNAYLRLRTAEEKERQSTSRFKTFGTPEENHRRFEQDIRRAYGNPSPSAGEQAGSPAAVLTPPASPPAQARVPPSPPPTRPARDKCDVMAVPLVRLPSGLMVCDWSRARPA